MVSRRDTEQAFVDCLKGDHAKMAYEKKRLLREANVETVIKNLTHERSHRDL